MCSQVSSRRFHECCPACSCGPRCQSQCAPRHSCWLLTSTVIRLRDQATRALYVFGRRSPRQLFGLAIAALGVNDTYVPERTLAACYGVVMANQVGNAEFGDELRTLLADLLRTIG